MSRRLVVLVLLLLVALPGATLAQEDSVTCDGGENDVVVAAQTAYDAGDLETALDLATQAETLCANNFARFYLAQQLKAQIDLEIERQAITSAIESAVPGKVNLGDYSLFMTCVGEGSPTVIFEHGLGGGYVAWANIQPAVGEFTRACAYDRLGIGLSDSVPARTIRTTQDQVDDLVALLEAAEIEGPYILVGHSIAGYNLLLFADQHPDWVAGMVMVDVSHPDQWERMAEVDPEAALALTELAGSERLDLGASAQQVRAVGDLGDLPLVVLTAGIGDADFQPIWSELQDDHARRSTHSQHIIAEYSGHEIMQSEPELVIDAIQWVLEEARAAEAAE